ncbi:hypothetical protein V2P24_00725 [Mycoplasma putrefaciens]|uniref:hypothetical protein n=1 Tax=Mycoplasma putrefaciens TaxID=2123 RepID=UPI003DA4B45D
MKKILTLLTGFLSISGSTITVISCQKQTGMDKKDDSKTTAEEDFQIFKTFSGLVYDLYNKLKAEENEDSYWNKQIKKEFKDAIEDIVITNSQYIYNYESLEDASKRNTDQADAKKIHEAIKRGIKEYNTYKTQLEDLFKKYDIANKTKESRINFKERI